MRLLPLLALAAFALIPTLACSASDSTYSIGDEEDVTAAKSITASDAGRTIQIPTGQSFYIQLASNASTGYRWSVKSVDKTLGDPKEAYILNGAPTHPPTPPGAAEAQRFTWSTKSPLELDGKHEIELEYARGNGAPAKTFTVTVELDSAAPCGTGPACGPSKRCSACKAHIMSCIPKGSVC